MRKTFLKRISDIIPNEKDTVFMTVDIGMWAIKDVLRDYPLRCMNVGIYEDAMMTFAAGIASRGLVPIIFGIQPYLIERALEQIKLDLAYQKMGVNVIGTGAAIDYSKYGYSHYCAEDVALIKQIPGVEFIAPGSAKQFLTLFNETYRNNHPTFFRISDHPNVKYDIDVTFGKANVVKKGKKATLIVVSVMLDLVMRACINEDVTILYYTTLEPFDRKTLYDSTVSGNILVIEPEYRGSLLYDIYETFPGQKLHIEQIGLPREIFRNYGTYEEKMSYYEITENSIIQKLQMFERYS